MYILTDGKVFIGTDSCNSAMVVSVIDKALTFANEKKAINYKENLKAILQKYNWRAEEVRSENKDEAIEQDDYEYTETQLEQADFNIFGFFDNAIKTISQLGDYANNMSYLEKEYDQKILDVRHYKRDTNTKLNAIQLQRLEQFEIQLERERYECKSNRIIAEIFLADMNRLGNEGYLEVINNIKKSEYKPRIFTFEMLDEIVGKKSGCKKVNEE